MSQCSLEGRIRDFLERSRGREFDTLLIYLFIIDVQSRTTRQRYGTIVKRSAAALESSAGMPPTRSRFREKMSTSAWNVSLDDVFIILDRFALGFVTLGVFVLFLIAVLVVEALEILWRWWTPERFPARGRSRIRLTGAERRLKAWENWERDRLAEESRGWWAPPRKCR